MYWGLRGGAGGLGVVTSFDFQLHPLSEVLAGLIVHPAEHADEALRAFRDFAADAPDEFCGLAVITHGPPLPFLDTAWHGRPVVMFAVCWSGDAVEGEAALAPLRAHGAPVVEHIGRMPYAHWQQLQDPSAPRGHYYYWKTANYANLSDQTINELAAMSSRLPSIRSEIHVQHMGGAVSRIAPEDSAFAHRDAQFFVNFIGITDTAGAVSMLREGIRALHDSVSRDALAGAMTNFADQDDSDNVRRFGLQNAGRLETLRKKYDPAGTLQSA